jgi:hypothetical protein
MQIHQHMRLLVGMILIWSTTALAQSKDAPPPAPVGPSGDAQPVDPYANPSTPPPPQTNTPAPSQPPSPSTSTPASPESPAPSPQQPSPAAPAPSQQQPAPQAPQPNTTPVDAKPQPPASEQKPVPSIDKPGPAPVDQPAPSGDKPAQSKPSNQPVTSLSPGDTVPGQTTPRDDSSLSPPGATAPIAGEPAPSATAAPRAAIVDVASAPASCREAGNRVSSRDHNTALSSKVSFALCTATSALSGLSLVDAEASVDDVDHATANAFALLDEVAASGDARWQIVALHAQGDLLGQMTRRMLDTVPPTGAGATQSAVALHDTRVQLLQSRLQPWLDRAQHAFSQVDQLARANPQLATNQMVGDAVADSRHKLTSGVATR